MNESGWHTARSSRGREKRLVSRYDRDDRGSSVRVMKTEWGTPVLILDVPDWADTEEVERGLTEAEV